MDKLNVIFITCYYPPTMSPRSVQISRLVQYLRHHTNIKVVAPQPFSSLDESLLSLTPIDNVIYAKNGFLSQFLQNSKGHFLKKYLLPDIDYFKHIDLYKRTRDLIQKEKIYTIVTFGNPMSTHVCGYKLKKEFPSIKWVAHFSDPWIDNPFNEYNAWTNFINKKFQDLIFQHADQLIFTSPETKQLVTKKYNRVVQNKSLFVEHCFQSTKKSLPTLEKREFIISYVGNFYGKRQPHTFIEAISHIVKNSDNSIKVRIVGNVSKNFLQIVENYNLGKYIELQSTISYIASLEAMEEADLLIIIDAPFEKSPFLPSKLVDYIGANKPIFGITPSGTSQRVIEEMGFLTAHPNDSEEIAKKLAITIEKIKNKSFNKIPDDIRDQYSVDQIGKRFLSLLHPRSSSKTSSSD